MVLPAMQLFVVLQLTATLLLVQTGHGHGQSTYDEERTSCVYTFVVPGSSSDEGCPGRGDSTELRRLSQSVDALKQIIEVLQAKNAHLEIKTSLLMEEREKRSQESEQQPESPQGGSSEDGRKDPTGGVVYVRWGRKTYPGNATLLYSGAAGGSYYTHTGGGSNYQCLPRNPQWGSHTDGIKSGTYMYGAEYEFPTTNSPFSKTNFAGNLLNNNVPCAVCHVTERHAKVMIPAWKRCPEGWTREYGGYLTSSHHRHKRATFECMDEAPEVTEGASANEEGALFYTVEADCGYALPCPNYIEGWALTCVVCTK